MQQFPIQDSSEHERPRLDSHSLLRRIMSFQVGELDYEGPAITQAVARCSEQQSRQTDLGKSFGMSLDALNRLVKHDIAGDTFELAQQAERDFGFKNLDQSVQATSSFDDKTDQITEAYKALGAAYSTNVTNPLQELTG